MIRNLLIWYVWDQKRITSIETKRQKWEVLNAFQKWSCTLPGRRIKERNNWEINLLKEGKLLQVTSEFICIVEYKININSSQVFIYRENNQLK